MWQTRASRLWLCCAARFTPAPAAVMTVTGRRALPPNMYFIFASWFIDLVHAHADEVHEHDVDDRDAGRQRRHRCRDRRWPVSEIGVSIDPLRAELVEQAASDAEHAAVGRDVLAGEEHVGVVTHALRAVPR